MNISELAKLVDGELITANHLQENEVKSMYTCDMLSWAMAKVPKDAAFVTILNNQNIVAVSVLVEAACVVVSEGVLVDEMVISRANNEDIPIVLSPLTSYEICVRFGKS